MAYKPHPDVLTNPYKDLLQPGETRRLYSRVSTADWSLLYSVYPQSGAVEALVNTIIYGITNELRKSGVDSWSADNQRDFVSHIRRCATLEFTRGAVPRDDTRESTSLRGTPASPTQKPTEVDVRLTGRRDREEESTNSSSQESEGSESSRRILDEIFGNEDNNSR